MDVGCYLVGFSILVKPYDCDHFGGYTSRYSSGPLSLSFLPWVGTVSTGDAFSHHWGKMSSAFVCMVVLSEDRKRRPKPLLACWVYCLCCFNCLGLLTSNECVFLFLCCLVWFISMLAKRLAGKTTLVISFASKGFPAKARLKSCLL